MNKNNSRVIFKRKESIQGSKQLVRHIYRLITNYIATRDGTELNKENAEHGLFGYIKDIENIKSAKLDDIKEHISEKIMNDKLIHNTIISLREEDSLLKGFDNQENWELLIKDKIQSIGKEFNIKYQNIEWVASFHQESGHPHVHLMFWDSNNSQRNPYVNYNNVKKSLVRGIFKEETDLLLEEKNQARNELRQVGKMIDTSIINEFKEQLPQMVKPSIMNHEFSSDKLKELSEELFDLRSLIANYKYQYQSLDVKKKIDTVSNKLIKISPEISRLYDKYINSSISIAKYTDDSKEYLQKVRENCEKDINNILGNQILQILKKFDTEINKTIKQYDNSKKNDNSKNVVHLQKFCLSKLLFNTFNILFENNVYNSAKLHNTQELSKQAKKEKYIEKQDISDIRWE